MQIKYRPHSDVYGDEFSYMSISVATKPQGWLGSRVVSVLESGAERPGFTSQPRPCRVTVLGNCSHSSCLCSPSALKVTSQVATPGAESAVYDCLVSPVIGCSMGILYIPASARETTEEKY